MSRENSQLSPTQQATVIASQAAQACRTPADERNSQKAFDLIYAGRLEEAIAYARKVLDK